VTDARHAETGPGHIDFDRKDEAAAASTSCERSGDAGAFHRYADSGTQVGGGNGRLEVPAHREVGRLDDEAAAASASGRWLA
jgi:hypothetical protein